MHKSIKVSEFLHRVKEPVELQPEQEYSLVTIKVHHRGVTLRNKTKGKLIGSKMHRISKGQFILSGIDARHGAFGIVPDELDGAIVTNDFWYFDIDETKVKRDFFYWLTNTPIFLNACIKSSQGVTQRVRLQAKLFFDFEFRFPPLEEQENFLKKIQHADQYLSLLRVELNKQEKYVSQLKQAILQEAIAGQLTAEWRTQNPMQNGNPDTDAAALLAKIKTKKQQAIADGKLKKENILPKISPDKIPFILPDTWVWCPFGEVTHFIDYRGKTPTKITSGIRLITAKNVKQGYLSLSPDEYISEQEYEERMTRGYPQLGDVFFTTEAPLGNACLNNLDEPISMGQRIITIRSIAFLSSYLLKVLLSPQIQKEIDIRKTGVTAQGIKSKKLVEVPFPLPPLAEQKVIVEKVDRLMNIIDQLEQQIKHRKQLAENLMQTVLREAFE
jgi:type I restriction enzyme S subunit